MKLILKVSTERSPTTEVPASYRSAWSRQLARLPVRALILLNERLLLAVNQTGKIFLSHRKLSGCFALKLVESDLRTNGEQVARFWETIQEQLKKIENQAYEKI